MTGVHVAGGEEDFAAMMSERLTDQDASKLIDKKVWRIDFIYGFTIDRAEIVSMKIGSRKFEGF